ncbi:MAG: TonB-dependent siderophore receptor [Sphingomonadales bacterium]|nr:TonB-dependent siderophore receptor [Sphingomonadales bacterium]
MLLTSLSLAAVAFPGAAAAALAEEAGSSASAVDGAEAEDHAGRSDIIVSGKLSKEGSTGTKSDTPLVETPQSISVIDEEDIRSRNVLSIADAVGYSSGVFAGTKGSATYGGDAIAIRGFGNDGSSGTANNTYIDGLRLGGTLYASAALDPLLFERIEVVKGPASVLYGQATPGGLINMVSRRPRAETGGEIMLRYGSFGRKQGLLDVTGSVNESGSLFARFTGMFFDTDDRVDFSNRQRVLVAPALTWQPGASTSLTLLAHYQKDDFLGSTLNWLPTVGTVLANPNGKISRSLFTGDPNYQKWNRELFSVGYQFEHRFSDAIAFRQNVRLSQNSLDAKTIYITSLSSNLRIAGRQAFGLQESSNDLAIDNNLQATFETGPFTHDVLIGLDWQRFENDTNRELANGLTLDVFAPTYYQTLPTFVRSTNAIFTKRQVGLYFQDQIKLHGWRLLLGLRKDWTTNITLNRAATNPATARTSQKDDAITKRVALLHLFDNGLAPYISYSEAFTPLSGTDASGAFFRPETGRQYEAGIKFQPRGGDSFVTASVFDLRRQNVLTTDQANPSFRRATGEITMRGFELEAHVAIAPTVRVIGAYTYLDAEVTKSNTTVTGLNPVTLVRFTAPELGKRPVAVPKHNASLWVSADLPAGTVAGAGARYSGSTFGDPANGVRVPDFLLFDASLRFDLGRWASALSGLNLALKANNIADKTYVSSCIGIDRCYYGQGRTVIADVSFRW